MNILKKFLLTISGLDLETETTTTEQIIKTETIPTEEIIKTEICESFAITAGTRQKSSNIEQIIKPKIRESVEPRRKSSLVPKNADSSSSPSNKSRTSSGTFQSRFNYRNISTSCRKSIRSSSLSAVVNVNKSQLIHSSTQVNFPAFFSRADSPEARPVERAIEARTGSEDGLGSMVRCLHFAHTYIANRK